MESTRAARKESFTVSSRVKDYIRDKGYCVSSDLLDAVSAKVVQALDDAIARTEANGRKTVRICDL